MLEGYRTIIASGVVFLTALCNQMGFKLEYDAVELTNAAIMVASVAAIFFKQLANQREKTNVIQSVSAPEATSVCPTCGKP